MIHEGRGAGGSRDSIVLLILFSQKDPGRINKCQEAMFFNYYLYLKPVQLSLHWRKHVSAFWKVNKKHVETHSKQTAKEIYVLKIYILSSSRSTQ